MRRTFQTQAMKVLDPERLEIRFNGEWLDMPAEKLFGLMRTATVARILERDDFNQRYTAGEPISILELLYPLLQGYDSVAIEADVRLRWLGPRSSTCCWVATSSAPTDCPSR